MTIYEQIQKSVDYIETNLFSKLTFEEVAHSVFMSSRSFYNYFWSVTGYSYKEYVRKRRLKEAMEILVQSQENVLEIALTIGYESHEAFTRAFKNEFGITPSFFRKSRLEMNGLDKIKLIKEMYMGVVVKQLPQLKVAAFEGFAPNPEDKAKAKMDQWLEENNLKEIPHRIFGHNIDKEGKISYDPENEGYKFLYSISDDTSLPGDNVKTEIIEAGKFLVTGIEGDFGTDPTGSFITEGWDKLKQMAEEKGYEFKERWFEEELEPSKPGNLRLDLYVEIV